MSFKIFPIIFLCSIFSLTKAQTCCSGGIPLSNNLGLSQEEKGIFQIGINYDYNYLNTLNSGDQKLNDNARLRITHSALVNFGYSITNNLSVEGLFTWINQRRKITQFGNENLDVTSGIGDAVLLIKYGFTNFIGKNSNLSLGLGTKIPLGSSTKTNKQGITLNADLQPGSNAWDIIYFSQVSKQFNFRPSFIGSARLIYRFPGTNTSYFGDSTYQFGEELQAFLSFSDQFIILKTLFNPNITFKYRNAQQDKIGGFDIDNTGGNWISIIPSLSTNISPKIIFTTKIELPIYSNVDGTQLTPTYRITSGVLIKLNRKPDLIIN